MWKWSSFGHCWITPTVTDDSQMDRIRLEYIRPAEMLLTLQTYSHSWFNGPNMSVRWAIRAKEEAQQT